MTAQGGLSSRTGWFGGSWTSPVSVAIPSLAALAMVWLRSAPATLHVDRAAFGWLLLTALTGQALGWLLFAIYAPRLASAASAALLLLTPVGSAAILGERPAPTQIVGCVLVPAAAYAVAAGPTRRRLSGAG